MTDTEREDTEIESLAAYEAEQAKYARAAELSATQHIGLFRYWRDEIYWTIHNFFFPSECHIHKKKLAKEAKAFAPVMIDKLDRLGLSYRRGRGVNAVVEKVRFYRCIVHLGTETFYYQVDEPYPTGVHVDGLIDAQTVKALEAAVHREVTAEHHLRTGVWYIVGNEYKRRKASKIAKLPRRVAYADMSASILKPQIIPIGRGYPTSETAPTKLIEVTHNFARHPHLLIAGATGAGKSTAINSLICALLEHTPQVQLWMIDLKRVELSAYRAVPGAQIVTEPDEVPVLLAQFRSEITRRLEYMEPRGIRHMRTRKDTYADYPPLYLIIDELAEVTLGVDGNTARSQLIRAAQLSRAADMHIVLATQRPSVDVVDGSIKANFAARLALAMASQVDSKTVLDQGGAEKLTPPGHALYRVGAHTFEVRAPLITDGEIDALIANLNSDTLSALEQRVYDFGREVLDGQYAVSKTYAGLQDEGVTRDQVISVLASLERKEYLLPGGPKKPRCINPDKSIKT